MAEPRFTVRIPDELDDALDTYASVTGKSKNSVFIDALRDHLADECAKPAFTEALKTLQRRSRQAVARL